LNYWTLDRIAQALRGVIEDGVRRNHVVHLHQEAFVADPRVQRIGGLVPRRELVGGEVAVGQGLTPQIHEGVGKRRAAESAGRRVHEALS